MASEASFTLRLIDKIGRPSRVIGKELGRVRSQIGNAAKMVGKSTGAFGRFRDALFGVKGGLQGTRNAMGHFEKGSKGFIRNTLDAIKGTKGFRSASSGMMDVFKGNLLTLGAQKVLDIGRAAIGTAAEFVTFGQSSRVAFGQLTKHGVPGEKLFELTRALSKRFGLDIIETTHNFQSLLAAQFAPKLATDIIKMGADLRVVGASADEVHRATSAISKIKGTGILQGDELNMLAEAKVSVDLIRQEMGKILGKGKQLSNLEVLKLQEAGKIDADTAIQAILAAVQKKAGSKALGDAGEKFANTTIEGLLGRIKAFGQDAGIKLVDQVAGPITKLASTGLGKLQGFLESPKGAATIDAIAAGLGKAAKFVGDFVGAFGEAFIGTIKDVWSAFQPLLGAFAGGDGKTTAGVIRSIARSLGELAAIAVGAAAVFVGLAIGLGVLVQLAWETGKGIVLGLVEPLGKMIGDVILWWDNLSAIWNAKGMSLGEKAFAIGKQIVTGLGNGILALASYPVDAILGIVGKVMTSVENTLGIGSPSKEFAKLGRHTAEGFVVGLESVNVGATTDAMFGPERTSLRPGLFDTVQPSAGRGGPVSVTIEQHIDGSGNPQEVARLAARESRREIEAFFRQLELET